LFFLRLSTPLLQVIYYFVVRWTDLMMGMQTSYKHLHVGSATRSAALAMARIKLCRHQYGAKN